MIRSITQPKNEEDLERLLEDLTRLFIVGCGTCVTLTGTGGVPEVAAMQERLLEMGKMVTGSVVVPVACDELSHEIITEQGPAVDSAQALVIMTCAFGVQTIGSQLGKMVVPALDTLFIGKETGPGLYQEVCEQCGDCILGETGGVCPVTACHKGLVNGPCGGTNDGKCEIDSDKDCAWTLIYTRLHQHGALDRMRRLQPARNHNAEPQPGKYNLPEA